MQVISGPTIAFAGTSISPSVDVQPSLYSCAICGALVEVVRGSDAPVAMLLGTSGMPNVRVLTVAGLEVHRCPFPVLRR